MKNKKLILTLCLILLLVSMVLFGVKNSIYLDYNSGNLLYVYQISSFVIYENVHETTFGKIPLPNGNNFLFGHPNWQLVCKKSFINIKYPPYSRVSKTYNDMLRLEDLFTKITVLSPGNIKQNFLLELNKKGFVSNSYIANLEKGILDKLSEKSDSAN